MEILSIAVKEINPAEYNPRKDLKPGDPEYEKLKKSILEFDMVEPLVWNKQTGNLVGGHQRLKILKELAIDNVEVSVVDLSPVKEKLLNIALNKIQGEWDFPLLKDLLQELDTGDFDIEVTGFDESEIENLMTQFHVPQEGLTDDDAIPENVETICKTGNLWQLGNHRLLCGDATKKEDVGRLMGSEKADMVFTDPPYGSAHYDTDRKLPLGQMLLGWIRDCQVALFGWPEDLIRICVETRLCPSEWVTWWPTNARCRAFTTVGLLREVECIAIFGDLEWQKLRVPRSENSERITHYPETQILTTRGKHFVSHKEGHLGDVWIDASPGLAFLWRQRQHPNEKPVSLCLRTLEASSKSQIICDLFGGSGSTLIACEKLGRKCFMMEIDEHYNDVIITRWMNFTGKEAIREDGKTWNELLKEKHN